jgi:hypothetical protein
MSNFRYEDGFKINNKYFPAIPRILCLSAENISRPPQSHETIPLNVSSKFQENILEGEYRFFKNFIGADVNRTMGKDKSIACVANPDLIESGSFFVRFRVQKSLELALSKSLTSVVQLT